MGHPAVMAICIPTRTYFQSSAERKRELPSSPSLEEGDSSPTRSMSSGEDVQIPCMACSDACTSWSFQGRVEYWGVPSICGSGTRSKNEFGSNHDVDVKGSDSLATILGHCGWNESSFKKPV